MLRVLLAVVAALLVGEAEATTVNLASPTGTVGMGTDGTNLLAVNAMCGAASTVTLYATCVNQVTVNANGGMNTNILNTSLAVTVASGGIASGGIASGALAAGSISSGAAVSGAFVAGAIADLAHGQGTMAASVPVAIASNQSTLPSNTAQVNGVTTLTGTGAVGTGAQRIAVGTDTATIAGSAPSVVLQTNNAQWGGTAITNVPTAVGTAGTGNTPTVNAYIVGGAGSGGTAGADAAAWTAGTTNQTPIGCEYTSGGATALVTAHMGAAGCTSARGLFTDKSSVGGTALTAAVSAYGTAPTGTAVEGVNAFITNTNANGSNTSANSSPVVIASDQAAVAIKAASGALASGSIASGALASGSISSGAAVSGAFVAGAIADLAHGQAAMAASVPVAIASNQSTLPANTAQVNGVTTLTGTGAVGTGAQRIAVGTDTATVAGSTPAAAGFGTNGSAPPTGTQSVSAVTGGATGGLLAGIIQANASIAISQSATALAQIIALSSGRAIYITSYEVVASGGANTVQFEYGTGTNCATGTTALTGVNSYSANGGATRGGGLGPILVVPAGNALCLTLGSATSVTGSLSYAQF